MSDDYRNTKYCPDFVDLASRKNSVKNMVLKSHPRAKDMHTYISDNDSQFKREFIKAYNGKCAYCGVSTKVLNGKLFEIDHFIPKESDRFKTKKDAGYIENLVLSCYNCNRAKQALELSDEDQKKVHPDGDDIKKSFIRDDEYYIRVSKEFETDAAVQLFYKQLDLENQTHRLDYLLLSMQGLREKLADKPDAYNLLGNAIIFLQQKRNVSY